MYNLPHSCIYDLTIGDAYQFLVMTVFSTSRRVKGKTRPMTQHVLFTCVVVLPLVWIQTRDLEAFSGAKKWQIPNTAKKTVSGHLAFFSVCCVPLLLFGKTNSMERIHVVYVPTIVQSFEQLDLERDNFLPLPIFL